MLYRESVSQHFLSHTGVAAQCVRRRARIRAAPLAVLRFGSWGKHVKPSKTGSKESHRGHWGLLGRTPSLSQDGADEDGAEGSPAGENEGLCEGLLQEEWPANPLSYRRDDGMPAGISPQVAQPVHTGKDE